MATNPEARLVLKIRKGLEAFDPDLYIKKNHGGRYSHGVPDLDGCSRSRYFALEVKLPGKEKTVTVLQRKNLDAIRKAGGIGAVVTSLKQAKDILYGDSG